jgi:hypothetical protein
VEGVVRLAEGVELPSYPLVTDTNQPAPPASCTPPRTADRQPVALGEGRGLVEVLVAGSEFDATPAEHAPVDHAVTIRDCRLDPPFVVATRGDRISLTNGTDYPFLPGLGSSGFMQALLHGETRPIALDQGRVMQLGCHFAAACGRTDIVVLDHEVHAVSTASGRFRIERFPAGDGAEVHAWHPLFEDARATVQVRAGEVTRVELVLRPAPPPPAPPPPTPPNPDGTDLPHDVPADPGATLPPPAAPGLSGQEIIS